jgi:5'-AMP-activated protein kinase regulatory gamma subunit
MSDTAEGTRAPAPNPAEFIATPTSIARHGHELIAQPSTFLLPRGHNRAMEEKPLTLVDKDQEQGLVCGLL